MSDCIPIKGSAADDEPHAPAQALIDEVDQLIARSSLGTPKALEHREKTPSWLVRKIAERCEIPDTKGYMRFLSRDGGRLSGADLSGADLSGVQLQNADLSRADLSGADLSGADLSGADLHHANLSYTNLEGAILIGASLNFALLLEANLDGATLFKARADGVRIFDTSLRYSHLRKAVLRGAILRQVDLTGADLGYACLESAVVAGAFLAEANLRRTRFRDASLSHVDLTSCVGLKRDQLSVARLQDNVLVPAEWRPPPQWVEYTASNDQPTRSASQPRGVRVWSVAPYERGWDPSRYLARQAERLAADVRYPPDLYVPQRYVRLDDRPQLPDAPLDLLGTTLRWLDADAASLVVVLGDFGHGKSFLLRQLARSIPNELPNLVPMLVELRDLDKVDDLDVLLAQHLVKFRENHLEPRAVRQMLACGQVALLFDGFDELALRTSYDEAAACLRTVLSAVTGQAKVVLTGRIQHFLSDDQWRIAVGEQMHLVESRHVRINDFNVPQIHEFLVNLVRIRGSADPKAEADDRLAMIRDIRDLLGLSRNPRMLSFIADLPAEDLGAVRDRTGQISSADLYRLLVDQWLTFEVHRRSACYHDGRETQRTRQKYRTHLRRALDALAVTLWETTEYGVEPARLERTDCETLSGWKDLRIDEAQAAHALGSSSLLVRRDDDTFGFIHTSVMEFLVAAQAAARLAGNPSDTDLLARREMSPLMTDFFCRVADRDRALAWARATTSARDVPQAPTANALAIRKNLEAMRTGGAGSGRG